MHFYQNKKSMVKAFIVGILLLSVGFLLIAAILKIFEGKAEAATLDSICKGSVALREKTYRDIYEPLGGTKVGDVATPLLCRTSDLYLPEDRDATKEQVKKEFAELMASCWNRYGGGLIEDVFKVGDPHIKNCQVCYTVSLRETSKFKDEITSTEFLQYLFDTPYKVSPENDGCKVEGGFCIDSENWEDCGEKIDADDSYLLIDKKSIVCKQKGKAACCYTDYECWNRGGICSSTNPNVDEYKQYDEWDCPSEMECFIENENYYSYGEYIQRFGGDGNLIVLTDIKPGETYAISFGSPTDHCDICTKIGIGTGIAAGGGIIALAVIAGIPTGGIGTVVVFAIAAGVAGYALGKGGSEQFIEETNVAEFFAGRLTSTIYLTTLNQIQNQDERLCRVVHELGEK